MNYLESFRISFTNLASNKTRSLLTMSGVIIGVMSIVLLISIIAGTQSQLNEEIKSIGSNVFMVFPGSNEKSQGHNTPYVINKLNLKNVSSLETSSSYGVKVAPAFLMMKQPVKYKNESRDVMMVAGVTEKFVEVRNWKVAAGRNFRPEDMDASRKVAVVGQTVIDDIFRGANPIGKDITIAGRKFRVVGVTEKKGRTMGQDNDDLVALPITTAHEIFGSSRVDQVLLKVPDPENLDKAVSETKRLLARDMDKDDFTVSTQGELLSTFNTMMGVLSIVMGCIAGISLLVGGIGIMNIMLVTVRERTREIGIRKAVGAAFYDILAQFMVEAIVIAVLGGILGILLSVGIIAAAGPFIPFPLKASTPAIIIAFIFSSLTGIFFGTYPAVKAAKTDPIVALRYE
jgi:putative ABC transport system permease protein